MQIEGFDQVPVDGSTMRAVTKEMAARREIRYLGLHQRVSGLCARERMRIRRLLLCCVQNLSDAGLLLTNRLHTMRQHCCCCCFSHSAHWLPTRKTTLHGGQSRSWSAEQGKKRKRKGLAAHPPPSPPPRALLVRRKIIK